MPPLAIAAIVILATAAITFYAFNRGLPFVHRFTLHAVVNNSVNVRSGSPVRIAGIDVGSVQAVAPAGNRSEITFTVAPNGLPIHRDATIRIRDRLFLEGSYYLELDPGTPSAPTFKDGDTVPASRTSSPVQAYQVLSSFDSQTRAELASLLNTLAQGFGAPPGASQAQSGAAGLKRAVSRLQPVLEDTAWITQAFRGSRPGDLETFLRSTSEVTGTLARSSSQLADLITGLNRTSSALASADGSLAQSVAGVDETLQAAPGSLSAIDRSLPAVASFARALDPSLRVAPPILDRLTATATQLASALAPASRGPLLSSLKATFEQFPALLRELGTSFPITKQVSECLSTHIVPILERTVPDGALSTGRPVWQDFVHFLPGVAGATGSFDANGPYTRTLLGAGSNSLTGGSLDALPALGALVGSAPSGGTSLLGARPTWVGDLTPSAFRPDAPCPTQRLPNLGAPTAAPDLRSVSTRSESGR
jgi:phospholipid/cholesterol/gamma-HCH transport system substrate-binding protein